MQRRDFIRTSSLVTGALVLGQSMPLWALEGPSITKLVILHTNDVHSRIEPFPMDGSKNQGRGGAARRAWVIDQIRQKEENVLLFDSGDFFQGTPYFNFFGGEVEIKLMADMKYDAATIGNHDFDGGMQNLADQLRHANFPILNANYNMEDTPMKGKYQPYKVFSKSGIKIGVFGVGIELNGLVPKSLYGDTIYHDPIKKAQEITDILKNDEKCDFIVCLSHLGYKYGEGEKKVSDMTLAGETHDIDLILGAHTHTFLEEPVKVKNKKGETTTISQVGWGGMVLGRINVFFEKNRKDKCITCKNWDLS